jgi:hypothetical protein
MKKTTNLFEEAFKKSLAIKELLPEQVHPNISKLPSVYHATFLDHANQIVKYGVDPSRAKGFGQGAGFYVFTDLQAATRHARSLFKGSLSKQDDSISQGNPVGVVVLQLQNLNADEWDIDYEVSMSLILKFLKKYIDEVNKYIGDYMSDVYFSKYPRYKNKGIPKLFFIKNVFAIYLSNEDGSRKPSPNYQITTSDAGISDGEILSKFIEKVKSHPKLGPIYNQFESQVMIKTLFKKKDDWAIKYTGNVDDNNKDLIVTGIIPFKELNPQPLIPVKKAQSEDENTVGGGALGPAAAVGHNSLTNTDWYAPGDYRRPTALGATYSRRGKVGKGKKKKTRKRKNKK